ncbi:relaxase domain-containing protein [Pseudonocardia sp. MCCB 268]|nr:relaxase domain-containing protein [Pseudonocardia cytotoxica]
MGPSRRSSSTTRATTTHSYLLAVSSRVTGLNGEWRTLDGRSLYHWRPAAVRSQAHDREQVTHGLGMLFRNPRGRQGRRSSGFRREAMGLISSRRRATAKAAEADRGYEQRYGRARQTRHQRDRISARPPSPRRRVARR